MIFENSYFEDEVRDGFYVPSEIKRAWAAQLEVLNDIDKVCRENNIEYFAEYGTLLGAVRHKGFIPWDDDMDISMKRPDYERFLKIAKDKLPEGYDIYNSRTDRDVKELLSRVINGREMHLDKLHLEKYHDFPYVVGIDIFPLDYISNNEAENSSQQELILIVSTVAAYAREILGGEHTATQEEMESLINGIHQVEQLCGVKMDMSGDVVWQLNQLIDKLCSIYTEKDADYITVMATWNETNTYRFPKEYYAKAVRMPFENTTIPVPIEYDALLRTKYGDYMKLVRNTGGHDYPFYSEQKEKLNGLLKKAEYSFRYEAAVRTASESEDGYRYLIKAALDDIGLSIGEIEAAVNVGDDDRVKEILINMQQISVDMGTLIETVRGEGTASVGKLEELCEIIYELYQGGNGKLFDKYEQVRSVIMDEIVSRKETVILVYKADDFRYVEHIWESEIQKSDTDVYVVVAPYYYKDFFGNIIESVYEYDRFDKKLNCVCAADYDMKLHHPDTIYIQNPYDGENMSIGVPYDLYSDRIKTCTEKLVYIQSFELYEFTTKNEREYKNMSFYCTVPGVVNADITYVRSEHIRQLYIKKLTEWAGEGTEELWQGKIQVSPYGVAVADVKKAFDNDKKTLLIYSTSGGFLQNSDKLVDKYEALFNVLIQNRDSINVLWVLENKAEEVVRYVKPELEGTIELLKERFEAQHIGCMCTDKYTLYSADAYYGDTSDVAQQFRTDGKPVMVMNYDVV